MIEDDVAKLMSDLVDKLMAQAIGVPPTPNKMTVLRYVGGRFESREIDDNGEIIEPPRPCPKCGPVLLCAEHMAVIS